MEKAVLGQRNFNRKLVELTTVQVYTIRREVEERDLFWFKYRYEELVFNKIVEEKELLSIAPSDIVNIDFKSFGDAFVAGVKEVPDDVMNDRYIRIQVLYPDTEGSNRYGQHEVELIARANQYEDIKNKISQAQLV